MQTIQPSNSNSTASNYPASIPPPVQNSQNVGLNALQQQGVQQPSTPLKSSFIVKQLVNVADKVYSETYEKEVVKQREELVKHLGSDHFVDFLDSIIDVHKDQLFDFANSLITDPSFKAFLEKRKFVTSIVQTNIYRILTNLLEPEDPVHHVADFGRLLIGMKNALGPELLSEFEQLGALSGHEEVKNRLAKLSEDAVIAILRKGLKLPPAGPIAASQYIDGLNLPLSGWFKGSKEKLWNEGILPGLQKFISTLYDSFWKFKTHFDSRGATYKIPEQYSLLVDNGCSQLIKYSYSEIFRYAETSGFDMAERISESVQDHATINEKWLADEIKWFGITSHPFVSLIKGHLESFSEHFIKIMAAKNSQRTPNQIFQKLFKHFDESAIKPSSDDLLRFGTTYPLRDEIEKLRNTIRAFKKDQFYASEETHKKVKSKILKLEKSEKDIKTRLDELDRQIVEIKKDPNNQHIESDLKVLRGVLVLELKVDQEKILAAKGEDEKLDKLRTQFKKELDQLISQLEVSERKLKDIYAHWINPKDNDASPIVGLIEIVLKEFNLSKDDLPADLIGRDVIWTLMTRQTFAPLALNLIGDICRPLANGMAYRRELEKKLGSKAAEHEAAKWASMISQLLRQSNNLYWLIGESIEEYIPSPGLPKDVDLTTFLRDMLQQRNPSIDRTWNFTTDVIESVFLKIFAYSIKDFSQDSELQGVRSEGIFVHAMSPFISLFKGALQGITDDDFKAYTEFNALSKLKHAKQSYDKSKYDSIKLKLLPKIRDFIISITKRAGIEARDLPLPTLAGIHNVVWNKSLNKAVPELLLDYFENMILPLKELFEARKSLDEVKHQENTRQDIDSRLDKTSGSVYPRLLCKFIAQLAESSIPMFLPENVQKLLKKLEAEPTSIVQLAKEDFLTNYTNEIVKICFANFLESLDKKERSSDKADVEMMAQIIDRIALHFDNVNNNKNVSVVSDQALQSKVLKLVGINGVQDLKHLPIPATEHIWELVNTQVFPLLFDTLREIISEPSLIDTLLANLLETVNDIATYDPLKVYKSIKSKKTIVNSLKDNPRDFALREKHSLEIEEEERLLRQYFQRLAHHGSPSAKEIVKYFDTYDLQESAKNKETMEKAIEQKIFLFDPLDPGTAEINHTAAHQKALNRSIGNLFNSMIKFAKIDVLADKHRWTLKPLMKKVHDHPEWIGSLLRQGMGERFFMQLLNRGIEVGLPAAFENGTYRLINGRVEGFVDRVTGGPVVFRPYSEKEKAAVKTCDEAIDRAEKELGAATKMARDTYEKKQGDEAQYTTLVNTAQKKFDAAVKSAEKERDAALALARIEANKARIQKIQNEADKRIKAAVQVMPSIQTKYFFRVKWVQFQSKLDQRIQKIFFGRILIKVKHGLDVAARFIFITAIGKALSVIFYPIIRYADNRLQKFIQAEIDRVRGQVKEWWIKPTGTEKVSYAEALVRDITVSLPLGK